MLPPEVGNGSDTSGRDEQDGVLDWAISCTNMKHACMETLFRANKK
jgi:hypothetical protein